MYIIVDDKWRVVEEWLEVLQKEEITGEDYYALDRVDTGDVKYKI
jgi:hypothetical protein